MTGNDHINITLTLDEWREVYRILDNDSGWQTNLREIEKQCRKNQTTIQFKVWQTWPMSSTIRQSNQELADRIATQMSAQCSTPTW